MIRGIGQYVGGKVLTALLVVTSVMAIIWYWNLPPENKDAIWSIIQGALIWIAFVAVLPWALFFVPSVVVKAESNLISALALLGYGTADIGFALYLAGGEMGNALQCGVMIVGFLAAAVYNFVVCESLARRAENT